VNQKVAKVIGRQEGRFLQRIFFFVDETINLGTGFQIICLL
jgi:hypothetical protein